jgi:hypothetical protein
MKETVGSLRAYFFVVAMIGLVVNYISLALLLVISPKDFFSFSLPFVLGLIGLVFAIAYFCLGFALRRMVVKYPQTIKNFLFINVGYQILGFLVGLRNGFQIYSIFLFVFPLPLSWYLLNNVQRLSREEQAKLNAK